VWSIGVFIEMLKDQAVARVPATECFIRLTAALVMLALIYAVVGLIVGVTIPLGEIYYEMNIEQHPQMCGVPGDYWQCKVSPCPTTSPTT
jgi:hypothetical protein